MAFIEKIVFKQLTRTDFARINSAGYVGGGGQAYIDFRTTVISVPEWEDFFNGISERSMRAQGPAWRFSVSNLGVGTQESGVVMYQRRSATVSITSQKLPENSQDGKRLQAWTPGLTGFPDSGGLIDHADDVPEELIADLRVFLIRTEDGTIWAGWHQGEPPADMPALLAPMFAGEPGQGMLVVTGSLELDFENQHWPFVALTDSEGPIWDDNDELDKPEPGITYSMQTVRKRDRAAAASVRKLYARCQISGDEFVFQTRKGKPYLEVHHLIPLGKGGADSAHNMIVVSSHVHKMLHHADVAEIDLTQIADNQLPLMINGKQFTITWHSQHAARVLAQANA